MKYFLKMLSVAMFATTAGSAALTADKFVKVGT